jgi:hypothetical protein
MPGAHGSPRFQEGDPPAVLASHAKPSSAPRRTHPGATAIRASGNHLDAVCVLLTRAHTVADIERIVAHTPFDRPASGRVLEKAGFLALGETEDEHEGVRIRVRRWQFQR